MSKDRNTGAKRARELRAELALDPAAPLDCLLTLVEEQLGLPVVLAELGAVMDGCCWQSGERVLLWVNAGHAPVRQRFTLAHEVGHRRCGHDGSLPVETFQTLGGKTTDSREVQANAFAAELLMPADGIRARIGGGEPDLDDVVTLACEFGVSTLAMLYRLNTLGLTSRRAELEAAIAEDAHREAWERLGMEPHADGISAAREAGLPRLSPSECGSAFAAVARGEVSTTAAAAAAGVPADTLARGAGRIGI
ncbi:MAG: ImmA/IrrE family metallo-endopeptidase [Baekduia sp.]